jgi:hypothetical protein
MDQGYKIALMRRMALSDRERGHTMEIDKAAARLRGAAASTRSRSRRPG